MFFLHLLTSSPLSDLPTWRSVIFTARSFSGKAFTRTSQVRRSGGRRPFFGWRRPSSGLSNLPKGAATEDGQDFIFVAWVGKWINRKEGNSLQPFPFFYFNSLGCCLNLLSFSLCLCCLTFLALPFCQSHFVKTVFFCGCSLASARQPTLASFCKPLVSARVWSATSQLHVYPYCLVNHKRKRPPFFKYLQ